MKVKALVSFVGTDKKGIKHRAQPGDILNVPVGCPWIKQGIVEKVKVIKKTPRKKRG